MMWSVERHKTVSSTQDMIKAAASSGAVEGLVIQADMQDSGRGRHGRTWVSQPGNLFFSFLLQPDCAPGDVGQISLMIGLAIAKAVQKTSGLLPVLKWPNDILIEGKKCCGILIEREGDFLVVGIGVNIASAPEDASHLGGVNKEVLLREILEQVSHYYTLWQVEGFENICAEWLSMSYKKGQKAQVKIGTTVISGVFEGVDGQGSMLLLSDGKTRTITAGEVYI